MVKYKRGKFFLIVILIFLLIGIIIHAQDIRNGFTIKGKITSESGLTSGARVDIYRDGVKARSVNVGDNGRYTLRFEFNHEYTIILSRQGCFPKKLVISTIVPNKVLKQNADFPPFEVEQSLFTEINGIEKSFSENTILKIFYDEQVDNFISEVYYNDAQIKKQIETAIWQSQQIGKTAEELNKLTAEEYRLLRKEYDQWLSEAGQYYNQGQFSEALNSYKAANRLFPKEQFPVDRIAEINDLLAAMRFDESRKLAVDREYTGLITQADSLFNELQWDKSKQKYADALRLKSGEQYPQRQISKIEEELEKITAKFKGFERYRKAIQDGDRFAERKQFLRAMASYKFALTFKPGDEIALQRIANMGVILDEVDIDIEYNKIIAEADKILAAKKYNSAIKAYKKALDVKPDEQYPNVKIAGINDIFKAREEQKQLAEAYNAKIKEADNEFKGKNYKPAKSLYEEALELQPNEIYPVTQIGRIDRLLAQIEVDKRAAAQYASLLTKADTELSEKKYVQAKTDYSAALKLMPGDKYPRDKIFEINKILTNLAKLQRAYESTIVRADRMFDIRSYNVAKDGYLAAKELKPSEAYPDDMITKIDSIFAEQARLDAQAKADEAARLKALEEQLSKVYNESIARADAHFSNKEYNVASNEYKSALDVKPGEAYPQQRIAEIKGILDQQAEVQKAYDEAIARADRNFNREVFDAARSGYNQALSAKPGEAYPVGMLAKIDSVEDARARLLAEQQASEAARLKALEERRNKAYNESIARADAHFSNKEYNVASNEYKSALDVKPGEAYPQQRIVEIKGILDQQAEVQKAYDEAIARADRNFNREVFDVARSGYNQALSAKPGEAYPVGMLAKIDSVEDARTRLLAEQQASEAARLKALEERRNKAYNEAITMADTHFSNKEYDAASNEYKSALDVKPGEAYPQQRIAEIKGILVQQAETQKAYDEAIARADKAIARAAYPEAQNGYNEALAIKPSEEYPKSQLLKIDHLVEEIARKQELERSYLTAVAQADNLYNSKQFELSIASYKQALSLKPNEKYPKAQIEAARINILELAKLQERQNARNQAYQNAIEKADNEFNARNFVQAESGYNNALTIKPGEDYPKNQLAKIAEARRQAILDQYNKIVAEADTDFKNKQYRNARKKYSNALIIIPKDAYAVSRIAEIDNIIESMAAAERERKRIQQNYMLAISQADEAFDLEHYTKANNFYTLALTLKPGETYPAERIEKIKQILERQKMDEKYRNILIAAYSLYQMKNYTDSRDEYVKALAIKPDEAYPKNQISKIDKILLEQERARLIAQQQATQSVTKQQEETTVAQTETISRRQYINSEMQQAYDEYIKSADIAFDMKEYNVARFYYREALGIIPGEQHPTGRLREIKKIIDGRMFDRLEREYQQWIDKADEALIGGELAIARAYYNRALGVKTQEQHPRDRLDEIASRLQQQRGQQNLKEYQDLISIADKTLTERDYTVARFYYMKALHLRPSEIYPKEQIQKIERALGR